MGMVAASLTHKLIVNFRPKQSRTDWYCRWSKSTGNYGDIRQQIFPFDSGSGKIKQIRKVDSIFEPDYKSIT
jgi:uncharacterized membrane protein